MRTAGLFKIDLTLANCQVSICPCIITKKNGFSQHYSETTFDTVIFLLLLMLRFIVMSDLRRPTGR